MNHASEAHFPNVIIPELNSNFLFQTVEKSGGWRCTIPLTHLFFSFFSIVPLSCCEFAIRMNFN